MGDVLQELFGQSYNNCKVDFSNVRAVIVNNIYPNLLKKEAEGITTTVSADTPPSVEYTNLDGRIGTRNIQLSRTANLGPLLLSEGDTEVEAQCHLGSILATACVYDGKWQYEATLGTSGIQQIGWATLACPFTNEEGVGDSDDSYAFDGNRVSKWHDGSVPYGQAWVTGDVIGSCIDLNNGSISYYRNGLSLGVAFTSVRKGMGYFPAISLSFGEKSYFNFGRRPFEYPVEGFLPLQSLPPFQPSAVIAHSSSATNTSPQATSHNTAYLTSRLRTLLQMELSDSIRSQDDILITVSIIFEYIGPMLLHEYHVVDKWYPFLVTCMESNRGYVAQIIEWMHLFMEPFEWEGCITHLFKYLAYKCRSTGFVQVMHGKTDYPANKQSPPTRCSFPSLALVLELLNIPSVRAFVITLDDIFQLLEQFITCKQPSKADLAVLLPYVWWQGGEGEAACSESRFLRDMGLLNAYMRIYEDLVFELMLILRSFEPENTGSQPIFFDEWLNYILVKNKGANRNVVPPGLSSSSVLVNLYFALLRSLFSGDSPVTLTTTHIEAFSSLFHKPKDPIADFSRLGGTLGYLQKTLGETQNITTTHAPVDVVMLDSAVMVYHLGVSSRIKSTAQQQTAVRQALAQLSEAQSRMRESETASARLDITASNLLASVVDGLRLMTYSRAVLVGDKQAIGTNTIERQRMKQEVMYKKTVFLADLIAAFSKEKEFPYMPEYYLESMVDSFHSLRRAVPPLPFTSEPYTYGLTKIVAVLILFFNDHRIVNPDVRDLLLQSIGALMQYNDYVAFIENLHSTSEKNENLQVVMVRGLLQAFDKKYWVTVTSILLRFWKGFGLGLETTADSPSPLFRTIFKDIVSSEKLLLDTFLNNLFNLLNSTISEFSVIKFDVTKINPNDLRKANFLFELSINLLRILEFISIEIPQAFFTSELNMTRLVELLLLILTRTTVAPEASRLDSLLIMETHVSREWILAPLVGVMLNLEAYKQNSSHLIEAVSSDASFKVEAFEYLLRFPWDQVSNSTGWLKNLEDFVEKLKAQQAKIAEVGTGLGMARSVSIELCTICYGAPIDTQFEPCKHSSCHKCISRHLLNNTRCFFCNADVSSTHPFAPE